MTLQVYILLTCLRNVLIAALGLATIIVPTLLIQSVGRLNGAGIEMVLRYAPMAMVEVVPIALPLAFLLGVVTTFGRLSSDRELTAIQMAGIAPGRLTISPILFAILLSMASHHITAELAPNYKFAARNFLRTAGAEAFKNILPGQSHLSLGEFSVDWIGTEPGGILTGVTVRSTDTTSQNKSFTAREAKIDFIENAAGKDQVQISFKDCEVLGPSTRFKVESPIFRYDIDKLIPTEYLKREHHRHYLTSSSMKAQLNDPFIDRETRSGFIFEINRRMAISITCILFALIGIPIGVKLQSSTQLAALTIAVGLGFVYFVLGLELGKKLFDSGQVAPLACAWGPPVIFGTLGSYIFWKVLYRGQN